MADTLLRLEHVSCRYRLPAGEFRTALEDISLAIGVGEGVVVLGAGGAGKTTLASVMAGVLEPADGVIERGAALAAGGRLLPVGLVTQNPEYTFTSPVVREEMAMVLENLQWEDQEIAAAVDGMLDLIDLSGRGESSPSSLSGGQKQLLAAASILIASPRLLLLDEPLSLLDARARREVAKLLDARGEEGATVYCTSDVEDIVRGSRVVVLCEGRAVWQGDVAEFPLDGERLSRWGLHMPDLTRLALLLGVHREEGGARVWQPRSLAEELCRLR